MSCSSSGSSGGPPGDAPAAGPLLPQALAHIADTKQVRAGVGFGRTGDLIAANGGTDASGPYGSVLDEGNTLFRYVHVSKDVLGISAGDLDYAVTTGGASLLSGAKLTGVDAKLAALDAKESSSDDTTVYRLQPDNALYGNDKLLNALPGVSVQFNVIDVAGSDVTYGSSAEAVSVFTPTGQTLASDPYFTSTATCLGDPLAAELTDTPLAGQAKIGPGTLKPPPQTAGVLVAAIGVSGSAATEPQVRMCVAVNSAQNANTAAAAVRTALQQGHPIGNPTPWPELLVDGSVTVDKTMVVMTAHPAHGAIVNLNDLPGIYGPYR